MIAIQCTLQTVLMIRLSLNCSNNLPLYKNWKKRSYSQIKNSCNFLMIPTENFRLSTLIALT